MPDWPPMNLTLLHSLWAAALLSLTSHTAQARVTRIMIDDTRPVTAAPGKPGGIAYEQVVGRAFGEQDPNAVFANARALQTRQPRHPAGQLGLSRPREHEQRSL